LSLPMTLSSAEHTTPRLRLTGSKHSLRHNNRVIRSCASGLRWMDWVGVNLSRTGTERPLPKSPRRRRKRNRKSGRAVEEVGTNRWFNYRACPPPSCFTTTKVADSRPLDPEFQAFMALTRRKRAAMYKRICQGKRLRIWQETLPPPVIPYPVPRVDRRGRNSTVLYTVGERLLASKRGEHLPEELPRGYTCQRCAAGFCSRHGEVPPAYRAVGMEAEFEAPGPPTPKMTHEQRRALKVQGKARRQAQGLEGVKPNPPIPIGTAGRSILDDDYNNLARQSALAHELNELFDDEDPPVVLSSSRRETKRSSRNRR
jgi:hypothetical protein